MYVKICACIIQAIVVSAAWSRSIIFSIKILKQLNGVRVVEFPPLHLVFVPHQALLVLDLFEWKIPKTERLWHHILLIMYKHFPPLDVSKVTDNNSSVFCFVFCPWQVWAVAVWPGSLAAPLPPDEWRTLRDTETQLIQVRTPSLPRHTLLHRNSVCFLLHFQSSPVC